MKTSLFNVKIWVDCNTMWHVSLTTNEIARNREFSLLTLHIHRFVRGQSLKVVTLQNAYMAILFDKGKGLSKEVRVRQEWKPEVEARPSDFFQKYWQDRGH